MSTVFFPVLTYYLQAILKDLKKKNNKKKLNKKIKIKINKYLLL